MVIIIFTISYFIGVFLYIGVCDIEYTEYDADGVPITQNFGTKYLNNCDSSQSTLRPLI